MQVRTLLCLVPFLGLELIWQLMFYLVRYHTLNQHFNFQFAGATVFNQDLCNNWHATLMQLDGTKNMFAGTSCPNEETSDPIFPDRSNTFCVSCSTSIPIIGTAPPSPPVSVAAFTRNAFITAKELRDAVDSYMLDDIENSIVAFRYGYPIGVWNVSQIQDFSQLFDANRNTNLLHFDADLSAWNVSNAVNMYAMFQETVSFKDSNNGLATWDVGKVTDMSSMFASSAFAGNISNWQVSKVVDFSFFTEYVASFTNDISSWNVSASRDMSWMFRAAKAFNSDVSNWDIGNIQDFLNM
jgi:Mycoplasma protein of unknown function, DUF285